MWGTTELVTVGVGLLAVLTTVLVFVFLVIPAQKEFEANRARRDDLAGKWEDANRRYGSITTTEGRVNELIRSVEDFEARLPNETVGRIALYQRLNGLIAAYGLTNTAGPDYAPLETSDGTRRQQSEEEKGRARFASIYPGVYVTMTVDGSYQNLRRFIREIESSDQFVVVSAVKLEPSENKEQPANQPEAASQPVPNTYQRPDQSFGQVNNPAGIQPYPGGPVPQQQQQLPNAAKVDRGKVRGETVTLRLELAAYFRRPDAAAPAGANAIP